LIQQTRSVHYYRSIKDPQKALRSRLHELAQIRVRYGYRRLHVLLRREGWQLGKNQAYRLYCAATAVETAEAAENGGTAPEENSAAAGQ
jgi:transposase InsO family protein